MRIHPFPVAQPSHDNASCLLMCVRCSAIAVPFFLIGAVIGNLLPRIHVSFSDQLDPVQKFSAPNPSNMGTAEAYPHAPEQNQQRGSGEIPSMGTAQASPHAPEQTQQRGSGEIPSISHSPPSTQCTSRLSMVELLSHSDPVEAVFVATGCGATGDTVRFVVVHAGGTINDVPLPSDDLSYGLVKGIATGGLTWSYHRAFARYADNADCDVPLVPRKEIGAMGKRGHCYLAATHRAWWTGNRAYEMNLVLPEGDKSYIVDIFNGFPNCQFALERLNSSLTPSLQQNPRNGTSCGQMDCRSICDVSLMDDGAKPVAQFKVKIEPRSKLTERHIESGNDACNFDDMRGAWNIGARVWYSPFACPIRRNASHNGRALCVSGDSHFTINGKAPFESKGAVFGYTILDCADKIPHGGTIVKTLSSHMHDMSADEKLATVQQWLADFGSLRMTRGSANNTYCLIISATVDTYHEVIPSKWSIYRKFFQNTWRTATGNNAVRKLLVGSSGVHFLDLFSPSEALHFDGHKEAVHLAPFWYRFQSDAIVEASNRLCHIS